MRLYHHHFALLSLLHCEFTTNVTIVVQLEKQIFFIKNVSNYREFRVGRAEALSMYLFTYLLRPFTALFII